MAIKTKSIQYSYDDADIEWWAGAYNCPDDVEDKEAWAAQYLVDQVVSILTYPYKNQIRQASNQALETNLAQVEDAVRQHIEVVDG